MTMQAMHVHKNTPLDVNEEFDNTDPAKFVHRPLLLSVGLSFQLLVLTVLLDCEFHSLTSLVLVSYQVAERKKCLDVRLCLHFHSHNHSFSAFASHLGNLKCVFLNCEDITLWLCIIQQPGH